MLHFLILVNIVTQGAYSYQTPSISYQLPSEPSTHNQPKGNILNGVHNYNTPISYYLPKEDLNFQRYSDQTNGFQRGQNVIATDQNAILNVEYNHRPRLTPEVFILKEPDNLRQNNEEHINLSNPHLRNKLSENLQTHSFDETAAPVIIEEHSSQIANQQSRDEGIVQSENNQMPTYSNRQGSLDTGIKVNSIRQSEVISQREQIYQTKVQNSVENTINIQNESPVLNFADTRPHLINLVEGSLNQQNSLKHQSYPTVINKHFYFHVPPQDMEDISPVNLPLKKTYNIIFIKLPRQDSKIIYNAPYKDVAHVEEKTLIYVLVKKTDPSLVIPPPQKVSEHEVLFVKYKDNKNNLNIDKGQVLLNSSS